jgi:hypothetical protein
MPDGLSFEIKIEGAEELAKDLNPGKMLAKPLKHILSQGALLVERQAKQNVPVDTGRLRASFTHALDSRIVPLWSKVGTNVEYAATLEYSGKSPRRTGRIPFFAPAIEAMKGKLGDLLNEARRMIEEHWGK